MKMVTPQKQVAKKNAYGFDIIYPIDESLCIPEVVEPDKI